MRITIASGIVTLALCLGTNERVEGRATATLISINLKQGDYLRATYIDELAKTCSPLRAEGTDSPELIKVRKEPAAVHFQTIINFHEGGPEFRLDRGGAFRATLSAGEDVSSANAAVIDDHRFRLGYGQFKPAIYMFVRDAAQYVAGRVLVGKYRDIAGRLYEFLKDGWASFPDHRFRFEIGIDHILNRYDYFLDQTGGGKVFAFKCNDKMLQIFDTTGEIGQSMADQPRYSLQRITK